VSATAKTLGIVVPVLIATTFCLTVPFIIIVADAAVLLAAILMFVAERMEAARVVDEGYDTIE